MIVREAGPPDHPVWAAMLACLHPEQSAGEFESDLALLTALPEPYVGLLAFSDEGEPIGMIDVRVRNYAEGAPDLSAAYIEDLWVSPDHRRQGVAERLLEAVEAWAREQGHKWLGSDALIGNVESHAWHRAAGFKEVERLVIFGKSID